MAGTLSRFRIEGLHDTRNIDIPLTDNKLILVGENGTGKSTVANLLYFLLTAQWNRMLYYKFQSVTVAVDSDTISVTRDQLTSLQEASERLYHLLPPAVARRLHDLLHIYTPDEIAANQDTLLERFRSYGIPKYVLLDYLSHLRQGDLPASAELDQIADRLRSLIPSQILYLPTYRRIEQDLKAIFPGVDTEIRQLRERLERRQSDSHYIELVEFGMVDVKRTIAQRLAAIKDALRNRLNNLTGTYLRDVIRGDYRAADLTPITSLDDETITTIFRRIDEGILLRSEQQNLSNIITKIQQGYTIHDHEKVAAHFLTKLVELYNIQQHDEADVREFARVCNGYLTNKELIYDNIQFDIKIRDLSKLQRGAPHLDTNLIPLEVLSSGEKQIVSLFSHIYLSGGSDYFVIIDEPELSLSVPWQKRFLSDILATGRCSGLIAVTHSPFIFDNELDAVTHSLSEFVEDVDDAS